MGQKRHCHGDNMRVWYFSRENLLNIHSVKWGFRIKIYDFKGKNKCPNKVKGQCQKSQSRINAIVGKNPSGKKQGLIYDLVATGQSVLSHCVCQLDQLHGEALRLLREWSPRGLRGYHHHQPH